MQHAHQQRWEGFTEDYIRGRTDLKASTIQHLKQSQTNLIDCFGKKRMLRDFNRADADRFRLYLLDKGLAENTVRRRCGRSRQFFNAAIKEEIITSNPFDELAVASRGNRERFYFITREEYAQLLDACPCQDWRLIITLSRIGGLRCPGEVLLLRWEDINWLTEKQTGKILVHSPKTEHHEGQGSRWVPLYPDLETELSNSFEQAEEGAVYCVNRYRDSKQNLRTTFQKIIKRAGLSVWPKLFQNIRSSRQTELSGLPNAGYAVCSFMGNSQKIADEHYHQLTENVFRKAVENDIVTQKCDRICDQNMSAEGRNV